MKEKSLTIELRGEEITVTELVWKDSLHVVKKLSETLLKITGGNGTTFVLNAENVSAGLSQQSELLDFVFQKSTGKDASWVYSLSAREALALLSPILELNLNNEVSELAKTLGSKVSGLFLSPAQPK